MASRTTSRSGFTLIELLCSVGIIAMVLAILLPSFSGAKQRAQGSVCLSNLRQLMVGWSLYADYNNDVMMPGRYCYEGSSFTDSANDAFVGNGVKYCARGFAILGVYTGSPAFNKPSITDSRQDYDNPIYQCPVVPNWIDERNFAFGYNYQFLGNNRRRSPTSKYYNYPITRSGLSCLDGTVVFADSMGTAAGVPAAQRKPYDNQGVDTASMGNHGWALDPPRLTPTSDRGTFSPSPRTAVDPRHTGLKSNVVFADGHGDTRAPYDLGYRILSNGAYVDLETVQDSPHNRFFGGDGKDRSPPDKPRN